MIRSLGIHGYRCFDRFEMGDLGRVNLLVGTNNSGKTSVLEALSFLRWVQAPRFLWAGMLRRGEMLPIETGDAAPGQELDVRHLFRGRELAFGRRFDVTVNGAPGFACGIGRVAESADPAQPLFPAERASQVRGPLVLALEGAGATDRLGIPLTGRGGLADAVLFSRAMLLDGAAPPASLNFLSPESLPSQVVNSLWGAIALTPEEAFVVDAMRLLDPEIERLAVLNPIGYGDGRTRAGVLVKRRGSDQRVPLGSMGDGMWRMLSLAMALATARGGTLLVDEIDTGLHYTVMADMWRLLTETAERLDVQVFATTHSFDCVHSLASVCRDVPGAAGRVSIQRIEPERGTAIAFSEREIVIAARQNIEVR